MTSAFHHDLVELFADPALLAAHPGDEHAAPYAALRRLQARLGDRPLLADHETLRMVLELSAIVDPRLFHVMFLHHCMTIGNALDQGAAESDVAALASARCVGAALMTEKGRGNSSSGIRTQADYDPGTRTFRLRTPDADAAKHPINVGANGIARMGVVSARLTVGGTDRGTALFLVPLRDERGPLPGVVIEPRPRTALLPVDYATVRFDNVAVPYARWLRDGAEIASDGSFRDPLDPQSRSRRSVGMSRFSWGAITAGVSAIARAAVARAIAAARARRTFDRLGGELAAIEHLNQQRLLCGAASAALAATVLARRSTAASWHLPPGGGNGVGPSAATMRLLSSSKVQATVLADSAIARCRSSAGAAGFFSGAGFLEYQALTTAFQTAGGDNRVILLDTAWTLVNDPDYVVPQPESAPDDWIALFRCRERLLHAELGAALRTANGVTFDDWNSHTELAQRLGHAHGSRLTAEALHEEWRGATHRELRTDLYQLHCLEEIATHTGWFLAHNLLTPAAVLALPDRVNTLCRRLAHQLDTLTTLLDVPTQLRNTTR